MDVASVMVELKKKGNEGIKKILLKHGVKEPFFGVKVEDLKVIQKKVKKDYQLSKDLYATGNADAMYLAGLIADEKKMTKKDLSLWLTHATSTNIIEYTVPWIAAESDFGFELALEWIDSKKEEVAACGWSTLASLVAIKTDEDMDLKLLNKLLQRVEKNVQQSETRVKQKMNAFLIALGSYVVPLTEEVVAAIKRIGEVNIEVDGSKKKLPAALDYIQKMKSKGTFGKKKKMARC